MLCSYCGSIFEENKYHGCRKCGAPKDILVKETENKYDCLSSALTRYDVENMFEGLYIKGIFECDILVDTWGYRKIRDFYGDFTQLEHEKGKSWLTLKLMNPITGHLTRVEPHNLGFGRMIFLDKTGNTVGEIHGYSTTC